MTHCCVFLIISFSFKVCCTKSVLVKITCNNLTFLELNHPSETGSCALHHFVGREPEVVTIQGTPAWETRPATQIMAKLPEWLVAAKHRQAASNKCHFSLKWISFLKKSQWLARQESVLLSAVQHDLKSVRFVDSVSTVVCCSFLSLSILNLLISFKLRYTLTVRCRLTRKFKTCWDRCMICCSTGVPQRKQPMSSIGSLHFDWHMLSF